MQQHATSPLKRKLILYFTYGIMTLAVGVISTVCILLVLGYRFDLTRGDVEQGALLQLGSYPTAATITLDNEKLPFLTPGKRGVAAGSHTIKMAKNGYKPWAKSFTADAGELRWLSYARLIPETIKTSSIKEFTELSSSLPSPDRKWMVLQESATSPKFTLVDLRDDKKPEFSELLLPAASLESAGDLPATFSLVEWDVGARYLLVKYQFGETTQYLRLDRTDAGRTVNVSEKLGIKLADIHFSGTSGDVFYGLDGTTLRRLDIGAGVLSQPIATDVSTMTIYGDDFIGYVKQASPEKQTVGVVDNNKAIPLVSYDTLLPVSIGVGKYFHDSYIAIGRGTTIDIFVSPEDKENRRKIATVPTLSSIGWLKFSSNGRFVLAGAGNQFTSYDIETKESYDVSLPGTALDPTKPLQWLDDYNVLTTSNNQLHIAEYDGANQHQLVAAQAGFPVTLSDNSKFLYSIVKTESGVYSLQSSAMVVER